MDYLVQNDEYLVAISNRGTFNRASKDLDKCIDSVVLVESEDCFLVEFEGVCVTVRAVITESSCSCSSRTTCKHIIMALLYLNDMFRVSSSSDIVEEFDDGEIFGMDKSMLFKKAGVTYQRKFLLDITNRNYGNNITKTSLVIIKFDDVTVKLLNPFEASVCSCESAGLCKHKALACLYYLHSHGQIENDYFKVEEEVSTKSYALIQGYITEIKAIIEEILYLGLSRASLETIDKIYQQSVYCYNYKLYNLSKSLAEICNYLYDFYENKNSFDESVLLNKIAKAYLLTVQIQKVKSYADYIAYVGVLNENFNESKDLQLVPLGKKEFRTHSVGVTYYFLEENENSIYSYTYTSQKTVTDSNSLQNLRAWNTQLDNIMDYNFKLIQPKTNNTRQIAQSNNSVAKTTDTKFTIPEKCITTEYGTLAKLKYEFENDAIAILKIYELLSSEYNTVNQCFSMIIADETGFELVIETYSSNAIKILQKYCKKPTDNTVFVGKVFIERGQLKLDPIEFFREGRY